jgi:integral membrane protein
MTDVSGGPPTTRTNATTHNMVRGFRVIAVLEALSWLILIVATIVKYAADAPKGVQIMGPIHGVLFIVYVVLALFEVRRRVGWDARTTVIVLVDSIIPGGGFVVAARKDLR